MELTLILLLCNICITVVTKSNITEKRYLETETPDYESYLREISQIAFFAVLESFVLYLSTFALYYGLNKLQTAKLVQFVRKNDTDFFLFAYEQIKTQYPNFSKVCQSDSPGAFLEKLFACAKEDILTKLIELFQSKHSQLDSGFILEAINCCIKVNDTSGGLYYYLELNPIPNVLLIKNGLFSPFQDLILKNYEVRIEK